MCIRDSHMSLRTKPTISLKIKISSWARILWRCDRVYDRFKVGAVRATFFLNFSWISRGAFRFSIKNAVWVQTTHYPNDFLKRNKKRNDNRDSISYAVRATQCSPTQQKPVVPGVSIGRVWPTLGFLLAVLLYIVFHITYNGVHTLRKGKRISSISKAISALWPMRLNSSLSTFRFWSLSDLCCFVFYQRPFYHVFLCKVTRNRWNLIPQSSNYHFHHDRLNYRLETNPVWTRLRNSSRAFTNWNAIGPCSRPAERLKLDNPELVQCFHSILSMHG